MASKGSVYRRGTTWTAHLSWKVGDRQRQAKQGGYRTKKEAEAALVELAAAVQGGRFVPVGKRTVGEYLDTWLASQKVAGLRETTIVGYERLIRTHINPALGNVELRDLDASHLDHLYAEVITKGRKPATVRRVHAVMHKSLSDAVKKGVLQWNPAAKASPPRSSAAKAPEQLAWTHDELRTILDAASEHDLACLIRTAAMTGMRRGELCGLRWSDVDLDHSTLSVVQSIVSVNGAPVVSDVKSDRSRRTIDLDAETVRSLGRWHRTQKEQRLLVGPGWRETGLVFTAPDGTGWHPDTITGWVSDLVEKLDVRRGTLHTFRHTHCTHLLSAGMNARYVSGRLGHSSVAFTLDRYGHVLPGEGAAAAAAIAALVDGA
jgi:integrase